MVNKTQFYKTKVALAVVLSLGLAACGDSDGDASTSTSESVVEGNGGNTVEQAQGTGSVQGTVLDTNGLPVMGATVSLAGQSVVTDASGYYYFTDVPVSGVDGTNENTSTAAIYTVTINAPEGYASATVNVTPANIQVDSGNNGTNGATNDSSGSAEQTTWFDGFLAQATTAVLPKFAASVTGVLRNCDTGAALPEGVTVALDFTNIVTGASGTLTNTGSNVSVGVPTFTTATTADGSFTFADIPTDSKFNLTVEGYTETEGSSVEATAGSGLESVFTTAEGVVNNLGDTNVCMITSNDDVNPYIASVVGSIDTIKADDTYQYVVLSKGIDGTTGVTLNFNEAMSAANFDAEDIVVTQASGSGSSQIELDIALNTDGTPNVTLAADGMSLTVVLAEALDDGQRFSVWFPQWQYADTSGNVIVTGDAVDSNGNLIAGDTAEDDLVLDDGADFGGSTEFGIASDVYSQQPGKIGYIRTRLCTYVAPTETPEGLTAEQEVKLLDSSELATSPIWDNKATSVVSNLNGQENVADGLDTGERLFDRFGSSSSLITTVENNTAVILGSVQNASSVVATYITGTGVETSPTITSFTATPSSTGDFQINVTGTSPGAEFLITPQGAFGVTGDTITVTVEDKVAPTTILQENYELWAIEDDYSGTTATSGTGATGTGGEAAEGSVSGAAGDPVIYIQPRHLSPITSSNIAEQYKEFDSFDFSTKLTDGANANPLYSGPGFAGWSDRSNSLGVAFSETIATGAVAPLESASVTLALTGVLNGLTTDIDNQAILGQQDTADLGNTLITNSGSDLARFTVSDMVEFANNDHDEAIDFTNGSIVDVFGNLTNDNSAARVVIRDAMPPFVTAARWDGSNIIITFNETIVPDGTGSDADNLVLMDLTGGTPSQTLTLSTSATSPTQGAYSLNLAGDELTVSVDAATMSGLFQNGTNNEFVFDSDGDGLTENHLALNFDDIEDVRGNSWATFDRDESFTTLANTVSTDNIDADYERQGRYLVDAPRFMVYNDVGIFTITKQTIGYSDATSTPAGDDDGNVTALFSFSHPIDLLDDNDGLGGRSPFRVALDGAQVGDYNGSLTLTDAQANAIFQIDLDGPSGIGAATNFGDVDNLFRVTFSSDYKVITLEMSEIDESIVAGTSQISFSTQVDSVITDEYLNNETYTVVNSN
jgi:hypothetical protein